MNIKAPEEMNSAQRIAFYDCEENLNYYQYGTGGGWKKYEGNPVFGGAYGTCFDVSLLQEEEEGQVLLRTMRRFCARVCPHSWRIPLKCVLTARRTPAFILRVNWTM